jgi:hypothetical protein
MATESRRTPSVTPPGGRLRSRVFGIEVDAGFEAPGLPAEATGSRLPKTRVDLATDADIESRWTSAGAERLVEETFSGKTPARTIDRDRRGAFLLYARHFGRALIAPGGDSVLCAPPAVAAWRWQRFLVGRVLPWASLLRGREVLHASAVRIGDRAVALIADSGGGKTSLAARLVLRGGGFLTDDVLALESRREAVLAHPGAAIVALRPAEREALSRAELRRLGKVLGRSGKAYVAVDREPEALPLGAIYFLSHARNGGREFEAGVDPSQLLASTFIASVDSKRRLLSLLDVCSRLDSNVPMTRVAVDQSQGSRALADAIWEHASAHLGGS